MRAKGGLVRATWETVSEIYLPAPRELAALASDWVAEDLKAPMPGAAAQIEQTWRNPTPTGRCLA